MHILFSSKVIASKNIAEKLLNTGQWQGAGENEWKHGNVYLIDARVDSILDIPTNFATDLILVLSSHKSKNPNPILTVHFPGNWGAADMGGEAETLNIAWASKLKQLWLALVEANRKTGLNWPVIVEADHHGPTISNAPIIYIEIGSSEKEWVDQKAGETVALAVANSLDVPKLSHAFLGVGGGHYAREFCEYMQLHEDWAVGHILAKYNIDSVSEKALRQAIANSVEKVEKVVMLKDSTNLKQKTKIREFCAKNELPCEEV